MEPLVFLVNTILKGSFLICYQSFYNLLTFKIHSKMNEYRFVQCLKSYEFIDKKCHLSRNH